MNLKRLAMESFVLLRAGWPVELGRQLLAGTQATHVIVHRIEPDLYALAKAGEEITGDGKIFSGEVKEYYYLYTLAEAREKLAPRTLAGKPPPFPPRAKDVFWAFDLHEYTATTTSDAYAEADKAPDRVVITDRGRVVGFYDADVRPGDYERKEAIGSSKPELRLLKAEFPEQIPLNESRSLLVSLSAVVDAVREQSGAKPIDIAIGATLTIIVQPQRGFSLVGKDEVTFVVTEKEEVHQFKVKAIELGPGELRVMAFNSDGQCLCWIPLRSTVMEAGQTVSSMRSTETQPVEVQVASEPDLSLLILEGSDGGKPTLTFMLKALDPALKLNFKRYGPVTLATDPTRYFQDFFQSIEKLPLQTAQDRQIAEYKLAAKGADLFQQVIPGDLQKFLWECRECIRTVQVQSEEHWIPWELCKLMGEKDGSVESGPFFCEAFEITRWLLGVPVNPHLHCKNMALIIPKDSGLPYAAKERDDMLALNAPPGRTVTRLPATFLTVKEALTKGEYDAWHFTGHGGFRYPDPNRSAMLLENGQELTPQDLSDVTRNLGRSQPLVFLNACQIGRGDMSLTDIGGFAKQFLCSGAAAFIGAYWSIYDLAAVQFAKEFYSRLLLPMPIGRAAKEARLAIKPLGDPTWLAYTVWASPGATVVA